MEKNKEVLLFVYGTLKKGGWNHYYLKDAEFMGEAETVEKYAMYVSGMIPFVVKNEKISTIKGELYRVNKEILKKVDLLEGHPFGYKREKVKVRLRESGEEKEAWMYIWKNYRAVNCGLLIKDGYFDVRGEDYYRELLRERENSHG